MRGSHSARSAVIAIFAVRVASAGDATTAAAPAAAIAPAATPEDATRHGFFMRFAPKFGYLFLSSNANVVSGFRQEIPSSARAPGYGFEYQLGREVWGRVSLAVALDLETYRSVRVRVAERTVAMQNFQLELFAIGLVVTAFPFEDLGWHTALKVSACSIEPAADDGMFMGASFSGPQMRGPCFSAMGGYEWQISRAWWWGIAARASYAHNTSDEGNQSLNAFSPGVVATITYY
ncbi:MAG TPA: hypothetical protein VFU02_21275 [Polyangiaceae bacterium]|nr:hypothetical protein [Polyangiaceae bacterium]